MILNNQALGENIKQLPHVSPDSLLEFLRKFTFNDVGKGSGSPSQLDNILLSLEHITHLPQSEQFLSPVGKYEG